MLLQLFAFGETIEKEKGQSRCPKGFQLKAIKGEITNLAQKSCN
jgi:hypothetical protein